MNNKYEITFSWHRDDDEEKDITESVQEVLNRHALNRATSMHASLGYVSGELCEVYDEVTYRGWWGLELINND